MLKYILKRLALALFVFVVIMTICFVLIKMLPSLPPEQFGKDAQVIQLRREQLGYNKPIMEQYFIFWGQALKGNWGISESLYPMSDVWDTFVEKLPYTVAINIYSMLISVPIGLALGIFAALKKNKWQDQLISTGVMVFVSVPSFVYALLIQYVLCFKLQWFNHTIMDYTQGAFAPSTFVDMLPAVLSLSFGTIAGLTRYTRAELTEVLTNDFMLLARTKGLTKAQATVRHAMRNAMVPIFPMILGEFISIMSGSLIIEGIFGIAGVGKLYIGAVNAIPPDYNFFMLLSAFYTLIGLVAGVVIDLSYGFIDPRIRMGSRK
ncbi:MAG: ABC transporter permease [Clostridia bacterium]|nr:ABC transporter permease [Clostridia bacterium]